MFQGKENLSYVYRYERNAFLLWLQREIDQPLKSDGKMLFHLKLVAKKDHSNKKQVNGKLYPVVFFDHIPGPFHIGAPVNIIKN